MAHGGMTREAGVEYLEYLDNLTKGVASAAVLLDEDDRMYLLDKIEDSRWLVGPTYNRGIHILMDVLQYAVEVGSASPNRRK
jgi:hypothetical protein